MIKIGSLCYYTVHLVFPLDYFPLYSSHSTQCSEKLTSSKWIDFSLFSSGFWLIWGKRRNQWKTRLRVEDNLGYLFPAYFLQDHRYTVDAFLFQVAQFLSDVPAVRIFSLSLSFLNCSLHWHLKQGLLMATVATTGSFTIFSHFSSSCPHIYQLSLKFLQLPLCACPLYF